MDRQIYLCLLRDTISMSFFIYYTPCGRNGNLKVFSGKVTLSWRPFVSAGHESQSLYLIHHSHLAHLLMLLFLLVLNQAIKGTHSRLDISQFCLWESVPRLQAYHCPLLLSNPPWSCLQPRVLPTSPSCSCRIQIPHTLLLTDTTMQKFFSESTVHCVEAVYTTSLG
jgi:hypothetical protein